MLFIKLEELETVNALCKICESYKDKMNIDINHGRQTVDGCSFLGVASLIGNIVKVLPITDDELLKHYFNNDVEKIGGYVIDESE